MEINEVVIDFVRIARTDTLCWTFCFGMRVKVLIGKLYHPSLAFILFYDVVISTPLLWPSFCGMQYPLRTGPSGRAV